MKSLREAFLHAKRCQKPPLMKLIPLKLIGFGGRSRGLSLGFVEREAKSQKQAALPFNLALHAPLFRSFPFLSFRPSFFLIFCLPRWVHTPSCPLCSSSGRKDHGLWHASSIAQVETTQSPVVVPDDFTWLTLGAMDEQNLPSSGHAIEVDWVWARCCNHEVDWVWARSISSV